VDIEHLPVVKISGNLSIMVNNAGSASWQGTADDEDRAFNCCPQSASL
jgi:hypothetical protein